MARTPTEATVLKVKSKYGKLEVSCSGGRKYLVTEKEADAKFPGWRKVK